MNKLRTKRKKNGIITKEVEERKDKEEENMEEEKIMKNEREDDMVDFELRK